MMLAYGAPPTMDDEQPVAPREWGWPVQPVPFVPAPQTFSVDPPPPGAAAEREALRVITETLNGFDPAARARMLRYLASLYGA